MNYLMRLIRSKVSIFLVLFIFCIVFIFYIPGNIVTIGMDDKYSNKSEQIPVDITITGRQYNYVTVNLSKTDIKDNLKLIDSINIITNPNQNKVISSEYLIGNKLDHGKYKFYINTTNLSEGYYELSVTTKRVRLRVNLEKLKLTVFIWFKRLF